MSGCQVIVNGRFHCDMSKLSYEFILMIYDSSGLYLHSLGKSVTVTFLNASTETVLSEHKCYVLGNLLGLRAVTECKSVLAFQRLTVSPSSG